MPLCKQSCVLRLLLRAKESKIDKLKEVKNNLEDLLYHQPHRHQEVELKTTVIDNMISNSLTEAREITTRIAHGCEDCTPE